MQRLYELGRRGVTGKFDLFHLREIHRYIFQDVFPWAGELRQVGMSKVGGAPFAYPAYIVPALTELLGELKSEGFLMGLDRLSFSQRAAYYLGEINAVHPFREGNGRTQREFVRQLALHGGHTLSWAGFSQAENTVSSIASHTRKDHRGLATIIEAAIAQTEAAGGKD